MSQAPSAPFSDAFVNSNYKNTFFLDVALGKPALQSSLMSVDELQGGSKEDKVVIPGVGPELAVDGDMSTEPSAGSCSITALEVNPWWKVDLQSEYIVTDVNVVSSSGRYIMYKLSMAGTGAPSNQTLGLG